MIDINQCVCIDDFREVAKKVVKKDYFDYIDSGSSNEITMKLNQISFTKLMIIPRILMSTSNPSMKTKILEK